MVALWAIPCGPLSYITNGFHSKELSSSEQLTTFEQQDEILKDNFIKKKIIKSIQFKTLKIQEYFADIGPAQREWQRRFWKKAYEDTWNQEERDP